LDSTDTSKLHSYREEIDSLTKDIISQANINSFLQLCNIKLLCQHDLLYETSDVVKELLLMVGEYVKEEENIECFLPTRFEFSFQTFFLFF